MEKNLGKSYIPENDALRSQILASEFSSLQTKINDSLSLLLIEFEKLSISPLPLSSAQIHTFMIKSEKKINETILSLINELNMSKGLMLKENEDSRVLNVDYKKFRSATKTDTGINNITSVIEYFESEQVLFLGGPGKILAIDANTLTVVAEIKISKDKLPVLFQYEEKKKLLYTCCMNMTMVEAYEFNKDDKTLIKKFELNDHELPGVASLKLIDKLLLTGGYDKKMTIWDTIERSVVKSVYFSEIIVCFEPISGEHLLIGGETSIILYNILDRLKVYSFPIHKGPVWQIIYHKLYEMIISGSCDNTIKISSFKNQKLKVLYTFQHSNYSYGVCLLDNLHILACGKDKILRVYDIINGTLVKENKDDLIYDGDWICADPQKKRAWISETSGIVHLFQEIE